jgi:hypothetical protein
VRRCPRKTLPLFCTIEVHYSRTETQLSQRVVLLNTRRLAQVIRYMYLSRFQEDGEDLA